MLQLVANERENCDDLFEIAAEQWLEEERAGEAHRHATLRAQSRCRELEEQLSSQRDALHQQLNTRSSDVTSKKSRPI